MSNAGNPVARTHIQDVCEILEHMSCLYVDAVKLDLGFSFHRVVKYQRTNFFQLYIHLSTKTVNFYEMSKFFYSFWKVVKSLIFYFL